MKKYLGISLFCCLTYLGYSQNPNIVYQDLNTIEDLEVRTIESILSAPGNESVEVGKIPDNWTVTPSGAFNYSVPIRIPEGTQGVQPQLSVVYNSQSGNGLVGYNWNIGGLSSISRISKSLHHSNKVQSILMAVDDRYALDGARLLPLLGANNATGSGINGMPGTEYGTESESFTKIVSHGSQGNGPEWFEVELKNGTKMEYGKSSNSQDVATGPSAIQSVLVWRLNKVIDLNGNYMEYDYIWLNGQQVIHKIKYTGNTLQGIVPYNEVEFHYKKRVDTEQKYVTSYGKSILLENLLERIVITNDGNHYKTYRFEYGIEAYSYLKNIVEEGGNNSAKRFIPTEFAYASASHSINEVNTGTPSGDNEYRVADFNGDGVSDLLRIGRRFNHNNLRVYDSYQILLNDNGVFVPYNYYFPPGIILQQALNQDIYKHDGIGHFLLGDFNGDGKTDISYSSVNETNANDNLYLTNVVIQYSNCTENSVNFTKINYGIPAYQDGNGRVLKYLGRRNNFMVGDFDGDGIHDLYLNLNNGHKNDYGAHRHYVYEGFILKTYNSVFSRVQNINPNESHQLGNKDLVHITDINGDGKSEIMQIYTRGALNIPGNKTNAKQFNSSGNVNSQLAQYIFTSGSNFPLTVNWPNEDHTIKFGDFNGDGKTDIMATHNGNKVNWEIRLSEGNSFKHYKNLQLSTINYGEHLQIGDFDADGKSDILHTVHNNANSNTTLDYTYTRDIDGHNNNINFEHHSSTFNTEITGVQPGYLLDYDGDGALDLMAATNVFTSFNVADPNNEIRHGELAGISTGYGEFTSINYESISSQGNSCRGLYTKGYGAIYPMIDFHKPLFVTESVNFPDQSGMNGKTAFRVKNKYFYEGAKLNLEGKGFLGFTKFAFEQLYLGANETTPTTYHETEYEFNLPFQFAQVKRSFSSMVNNSSCKLQRVFLKNLSSSENFYSITDLSTPWVQKRYSNRLIRTIIGDNLTGSKKSLEYNYLSSNSTLYGNPDQVVETVGDASTAQVVTTTDYEYGQFGTHIPAHVISTTTAVQRDGLDPAIVYLNFDFDTKGNLILEKRVDDVSASLVETSYDYSSNFFGLATIITEYVPGHSNGLRLTKLEYDNKGRHLLQRINPLEYVENWTYDPISSNISTYDDIIDGNPLHVYTYDEFHRKKGELDSYGNTITIERDYDPRYGVADYESDRRLYSLTITSSLGGGGETWYDHLGRVRRTENYQFSQSINTVTNYFSRGMVMESYEPFEAVGLNNRNSYSYDEFGRNTEVSRFQSNNVLLSRVMTAQPTHTGIVAPYTYTNRSVTTTSTDLSGKSKSITYDPTGAMSTVLDDGGTLQYFYNSFGKPTEILLDGSMATSMQYDDLGYQNKLFEVNSGETIYKYNVIGELTYQKDANNNITDNLVYDELGRLLSKTTDGKIFTYAYNNSDHGIGQLDLESSQSNGIWNKYHYDANGDLVRLEENIQGKVFTTKYDYLNGRLIQEEYNKTDQINATILDYKYFGNGSLSSVEDANGISSGTNNFYTCLGKNDNGLCTSFDRINGDVMSVNYSASSLPSQFSSNSGYYDRTFVFNNSNGNLISRKGLLPAQDESFVYDLQERLKETILMGTPFSSIDYDNNGNISNKSDIGEYAYHPTKKNALMEVTNDLAEVQTTTQIIEYDAFHNPTRIEEGDWEWVFEYGPNHQRKKATIRNLNDGAEKYRYYTVNAEYEYDVDDQVIYQVDYVSGGGELVGAVVYDGGSTTSNVYAIYTDYLGSIDLVTDEFGNTVADLSYDAWGRYRDPLTWLTPSQGSGFEPNKPDWLWRGYTGHEHMEEFQLINMNGRLYDPLVGRMLSPDNFVQDNTSSQNYNRYSYVFNNPLKYTDPSGELVFTTGVIIAMSAGALAGGYGGYKVGQSQGAEGWAMAGYISGGAVIGAASGFAGAQFATAGTTVAATGKSVSVFGSSFAFQNTAGIVASSAINSGGMSLLSGGQSDFSVNFGAGSYNFSQGEFGYLGKSGNSTLENIGYGVGAFANLSDAYGFAMGAYGKNTSEVDLVTKNDPI